jgi:hypothetical protein
MREKYVIKRHRGAYKMAMSIGRFAATIVLSPAEREKLTLIANRPKSNRRDAERARIIPGASEGLSNTEIARRERVSLPTVGKWRSRYARERIEVSAMHLAAELREASTTRRSRRSSLRRWRLLRGLEPTGVAV